MDCAKNGGADGAGPYKVTVITGENGAEAMTLFAEDGENLYRLLKKSGVRFTAPCGGGGKCGKCLVCAETGASSLSPPTPEEMKPLTEKLFNGGYRLACYAHVAGDITISVAPGSSATAKILTSGIKLPESFKPYVRKLVLELGEQTLESQTPDAECVMTALSSQYPGYLRQDPEAPIVPDIFANVGVLKKLPELISAVQTCADIKHATCVCAGGRIYGVEPGDTGGRIYGAAFDIGTTTIAGYLFDMAVGTPAAVASDLNPQARFGADVITRINHTISSPDGADEMRSVVTGELNRMIGQLASQCGIEPGDIYSVYIVGNTTMLHFFTGLPAAKIAASPFIPAVAGLFNLSRGESGLSMNASGVTVVLPGVSAYVGADTLAAAVACDVGIYGDVSLLIDIGTNGEILLGNSERLYACSTAAGPAFEGASIRNGVGGVDGAVDSVEFGADGGVSYTTIGGAGAIGICGSGLVDAISQLIKYGIIDETGRLLGGEEAADAGTPQPLAERLVVLEGEGRAFRLVSAGEKPENSDIYITQRDVRELQNAKAAIAAGIKTLLSKAGLNAGDVREVYLAGGFGNYIKARSALDIGLIPREFDGRITPSGNAAGAGAVCALLSADATARMTELSGKIDYIELSASAEFTNAYIDCMMFE